MSAEVTETEEEILVYAEFEDSVNIEKYRAVHVLGIEEKNPIIQMDENFFTGTNTTVKPIYLIITSRKQQTIL